MTSVPQGYESQREEAERLRLEEEERRMTRRKFIWGATLVSLAGVWWVWTAVSLILRDPTDDRGDREKTSSKGWFFEGITQGGTFATLGIFSLLGLMFREMSEERRAAEKLHAQIWKNVTRPDAPCPTRRRGDILNVNTLPGRDF